MSSTDTPARPPQDLTTSSDHDEHDDVPDTPESSLTAVLERIKARSEAAGRTVAIDLPPGPSSSVEAEQQAQAPAQTQTPAAPAPGSSSYDVDSARRLLVQAQRRTDRILTDQQQRRMLMGGTAAGHDAVSDELQQLQQARQSSSGIIASAGNWLFGSKIERRKKEELRAQVEEQRRVLRRAIRRGSAAKNGGGKKGGHHPHHAHHQHHHDNDNHGAAGGIFGRGICSALAAAYSYEESDDDINENDGDNDGAASTTSSQCSKCSSATSASRKGGEDDNDDVVEHPIDTGSGYHVNVHVPSPNKGDKDDNRDANDDANNANNDNDSADDDDLALEVVVEAEPNTTKHILTAAQRRSVALHVLPPSVRYCRWRRLYSLARDGDSFEAFLRHVAGWKRTLLVLSTSRGDVFGAYADSAWENQGHSLGATFYGSAQASLWRIQSNDSGGDGDSPSNKVIVYKWTGANRYIQLCDPQAKLLALGGGGDDGEFGLCVENDFQRGSTGSCETFGNDPLCGQDRFDIVDLECYGFPTGFA